MITFCDSWPKVHFNAVKFTRNSKRNFEEDDNFHAAASRYKFLISSARTTDLLYGFDRRNRIQNLLKIFFSRKDCKWYIELSCFDYQNKVTHGLENIPKFESKEDIRVRLEKKEMARTKFVTEEISGVS